MKGLATKLVRIMGNTKRIAKNGRNDFHKYDYVTEADVLEEVRENLVKENVFVFSSVVASHREGDITSVQMRHTMVDGDSGETFEVLSIGQGQDKTDKGANKAITAAVKYMLLKNLMMPTGDDPEATDADGKPTGKSVKIVSMKDDGGDKKAYGFSNKTKPKAAVGGASVPGATTAAVEVNDDL